jgi:hypothetical protein
LGYEILLVRAFAIEHFHHFAYMAISVAMLGFGVSGTMLALVRNLPTERATRWFRRTSVLTAVALLVSPALIHRITLDATQIAVAPEQLPRLAAVYLLAALPFALGAIAVLLALTIEAQHPGQLYGASFIGSGAGAVVAVAALWIAPPEHALAVPAVIAAVGGTAAFIGEPPRWGGLAALLIPIAGLAIVHPPWRFDVTPYKELPQVEAYPDAQRVLERTNPVGWVVAVTAPAFRYAPGLSLAYRGAFPSQTALFVDGQIAGATARWAADTAADAMLDWLPASAPYAFSRPQRVLVLGSGGGTDVWNAVSHGAASVTAVELQPGLVQLSTDLSTVSPAWTTSDITWQTGDGRSFVARTDQRFDLISLAQGGGFGLAAAGVHALNEDFLHTVEAYRAYLSLLREDGVLVMTSWLRSPPRESVRTILTVGEALRHLNEGAVERGLAVVRSWGTTTVLAKPSGFRETEISALANWAEQRQFDLDWYPGLSEPQARYNIIDDPVLFRAAAAIVAGAGVARRFAAAYPFAVTPATDARPYPHHFLRTRSLGRFLRASPGDWLPFAEWGYLTLVATLAQSAVLAGLFMLVPAALRARGGQGLSPLLVYFTAIGLAYLTAEIAAIQQLGLLLGHPVYAVAVVLTALLIFSGVGSFWSDRLHPIHGRMAGVALVGVFVVYAIFLLDIVHVFQSTPLPARALVAFVLLAPPALLMGLPFPIGLRVFGNQPNRVAWAWAANGFASVVAAPLAALLALESGSAALFLLAAAAYGGAALLLRTA